jgi:cell wall-associated NlpC family hydrolase
VRGLGLAAGLLAALALGGVVVLAVAIAGTLGGGGGAPSAGALRSIPPAYLQLYEAAAETCPGLPWTVLAAIGTVESSNGQSTAPGVSSGSNFAGAEGPMQFEAATFSAFAVVAPGGADPPSPYDPPDAVYTAARMLCSNGGGDPSSLPAAVYDYNHSSAYVRQVLSLAGSYGSAEGGNGGSATAASAVSFAESQIGTPYVWGGSGPGGFDCSGLVQAAYAAAGVPLPRVARDQYDAGPRLAPGAPLEAGDLVFFGSSASDVEHVGIFVGYQGGDAVMVDAPNAGSGVRTDDFSASRGAAWGDEAYLGATRPAP